MAGLSGQSIFSAWGQLQLPVRLQGAILVCPCVIMFLSISAICLCSYVSDTISDLKEEAECANGKPDDEIRGAHRSNYSVNQIGVDAGCTTCITKGRHTRKVSYKILSSVNMLY